MARTTEAEVLEILDTTLTSDQITPYVTTANLFVTTHLSGSGLSASLLAEIERYIAAHIISLTRDQKPVEAEIDGVREVYQGKTGINLKASFYGQVASSLDSTGKLSQVGKGKSSIAAVDLDLY